MRRRKLNFYDRNTVVQGLSMEPGELETILEKHDELYSLSEMEIGGKTRPICSAQLPLKKMLRKLHLQLRRLDVPQEFFGGVRGRSTVGNAKHHSARKFVLNLDLKDFFRTITPLHLKKAFLGLGCDGETSEMLAKITSVDVELPQGFSTSPLLSVLALQPLANELRALLAPKHFVFSFWIDDLTISGYNNPMTLMSEIRRLCSRHGFALKEEKTHLGEVGKSRQEVTGIVINGRHLSPAPGFREATSKMIHLLHTHGWEVPNSIFALDAESEEEFNAIVDGRIGWMEQLGSAHADQLRQSLTAAL